MSKFFKVFCSPNAEIIADRFHVMKIINTELDSKRKEINLKFKAKKTTKFLKILRKSKYVLLKNEDKNTEIQQKKLQQVKQQIPLLGKMHNLKEEFRRILDKKSNWLTGLNELTDWLLTAYYLFPRSCQTIIRWFPQITGYFDTRLTQGIVEGINNKLKLIKRSGYGFKNFDNFRIRSLLNWHFY